jgi:hypothetical protein
VTLVNILVKVFHSRDGAADFNIDVALVPHGQVGVVRDDPTVVKDKKPMASFAGTDIPPIEVILDFIPGDRHIVPIGPTCSRLRRCSRQSPSYRLHHDQSMVVTLVNILVKVFHSRDGAADFNIHVALVPHGQVGVVRDDPTVVKDKARAVRGRG